MTTVLFATSEVHPLAKTGGLADVSGALPPALRSLGHDVRLILPAYPEALAHCERLTLVRLLDLPDAATPVRLLEGTLPGTDVPLYLVDCPIYFDRLGGLYGNDKGDWPDNPHRFTLFSRAVVALAEGRAGLGWIPEVVHCNDWQTGLVPALLAMKGYRPKTVFTLHNLSYQGLFSWGTFVDLGLPMSLWSPEGIEFYNHVSFIKGGLVYADLLTAVSPTYAREIRTPAFGYGLEGLLTARAERLVGILNGANYTYWDPQNDTRLPYRYSSTDFSGKAANKAALQRRMVLPVRPKVLLLGFIGRLVEQKGFDLVLSGLPDLLHHPVQVVVLGSGEKSFEQGLRDLATRFPTQVAVQVGYDEDLAHLIEAGADAFVMPSRFEPCGLNQLYSLRYGTLPVVRRTGGLADTVVDATPENIATRRATGFIFDTPTSSALIAVLTRALHLYYNDYGAWQRMREVAMAADYSWTESARHYADLYQRAISGHFSV
ncbi:Glycogen synthase 2 [Gammaproteobacteria bacterium]